MGEKPNYPILKKFVERLSVQTHGLNFKVVVFGEDDILFAKDIMAVHPRVPMYFQVGNPWVPPTYAPINKINKLQLLDDLAWLAERVCKDPELDRVKVLPQLHALMWGTERCR
jgi:7-carboxy-7-deazaguanine synthase